MPRLYGVTTDPAVCEVDPQVTDTVLRIISAKKSDSGRYRCRLRTGGGAVLFRGERDIQISRLFSCLKATYPYAIKPVKCP